MLPGDVLGRFDADCMIRPDWVEVVAGIFTEDPEAMGATGPVMYYDMPSRHFGLRSDNSTRKRIYKADDGQPLLFGSNMALRASAWHAIAGEVCRDKSDVMHEDIDISLHLLGKDMKTVYCPRMIAGISARRMDTSPTSFLNYMRRFKNTFNAHPQHSRKHKPEILITALYPVMHMLYPVWQKVLDTADINPAEAAWITSRWSWPSRRAASYMRHSPPMRSGAKSTSSRHPPTAPQSRRECTHPDRPKESWRVSREGTPEFFRGGFMGYAPRLIIDVESSRFVP